MPATERNDTASTFPELFARVVSERGDHPALATRAETLSYRELEQRSAQMARALLAQGAAKGCRIALMAPDSILWITTYLACLRIGALLSVISTLCTPPELAHMLRNSDTQFLIAARSFLRHNYADKLATALTGLKGGTAGALRLADAPYLRAIWLDDARDVSWAQSVDDLLAAPNLPDAGLLSAVENQVMPGDDAVIVYTSGSTSLPKAVVHTQRTIATHPGQVARLFLLQPDDRMMPLLPAFWLGGMVMALEVFSVGATLVYPDSPDTDVVLDTLESLNVNRINSWGDMLVKLREAAIERGIDVDAIVGLGPFRDRNDELIPPHLQSNMLGMSETFAVHSAEALDVRLPESKAGASGRSINAYERRIVNPDTGEEVAAGDIGELQLRGGGLMSGFYNVPRAKVFTTDGFYPTGDLVRVDAEGYLYFIARRGDMIKTKAANVSRLEVEAALRSLPEVENAVVAGLSDAQLGQRVVAAVVLKPHRSATEDSLQSALRDVLSSYKVPRNIVFIDEQEIPRTSTGKVRLSALSEMIASRIAANTNAALK